MSTDSDFKMPEVLRDWQMVCSFALCFVLKLTFSSAGYRSSFVRYDEGFELYHEAFAIVRYTTGIRGVLLVKVKIRGRLALTRKP